MPHTLSDLVYYRADLRRIAPLTREEEALLVGQLRLARQGLLPAQLARQARQRLVEGNQSLVIYLARKYHASFRRLDLEDLIQEGNLALVQATERCPYRGETFSGYASLAIREGFAYARCHDWPIYLSRDVLSGFHQRGEIEDNALLHACSLDHPVQEGEDRAPLAETLAAPPTLLAPNMDDAAKTRLVEMLLAGLTEQQRQVLRLRFGLDPADQREYPLAEIAERLNLPETNVSQALKRALAACRRLYAQQGQGRSPRAPHRYQEARDERMAHKRLEQFQKLEEAALALRAQERHLGAKRLAALAHVDDRVAREYVRTHRDETYEQVQHQAEQQRLAEAYASLEAEGIPQTLDRLCQRASVGVKSASVFLQAKAGNNRERLAAAYAQLQGQGLNKIGRRRLAQAAQVSEHRAELFLRERQAACAGTPH